MNEILHIEANQIWLLKQIETGQLLVAWMGYLSRARENRQITKPNMTHDWLNF